MYINVSLLLAIRMILVINYNSHHMEHQSIDTEACVYIQYFLLLYGGDTLHCFCLSYEHNKELLSQVIHGVVLTY